jgi:hypothetical protein
MKKKIFVFVFKEYSAIDLFLGVMGPMVLNQG